MAHARPAAPGELAGPFGCISSLFVDEGLPLSDIEYGSYYDAQGFPLAGRLLVSNSENGASVVVDIDLLCRCGHACDAPPPTRWGWRRARTAVTRATAKEESWRR